MPMRRMVPTLLLSLAVALGGCATRAAETDSRPSDVDSFLDQLTPTELEEAEYSAWLIQRGVDFEANGGRDVLIARGRELCDGLAQPGAGLIRVSARLMDDYGLSRDDTNAIAGGAVAALCPEHDPSRR